MIEAKPSRISPGVNPGSSSSSLFAEKTDVQYAAVSLGSGARALLLSAIAEASRWASAKKSIFHARHSCFTELSMLLSAL
jgi:hypothetical protein